MVIALAAGGPTDLVGRQAGAQAERKPGQAVIVDKKTGRHRHTYRTATVWADASPTAKRSC